MTKNGMSIFDDNVSRWIDEDATASTQFAVHANRNWSYRKNFFRNEPRPYCYRNFVAGQIDLNAGAIQCGSIPVFNFHGSNPFWQKKPDSHNEGRRA
jgi:hypothetical protein